MKKNVRLVVLMFSFLCFVFGMGNVIYAQAPGIGAVGGFEGNLPSFWKMGGQPSGATLTWTTDQFRSMGHSLKIEKPTATADSAAWVSDNMCAVWSSSNPKGVDIWLGAYIKTTGVNINPTADDQRWYVAYTFYDTNGVFIKQTKLPIDQTVTSSNGFVADTNAVGQTILSKDSWKTIVSFVAGKNATGTVWADDFGFTGRGGNWAGQDWNQSVGVPTGWYYWLPPIGGNDDSLGLGFENTIVTTEAAHSGTHSLKFTLPVTHIGQDAFVGTLRVPLDPSVTGGTPLRVSAWLKASGLYPDSARKYPGTWAVGVTPLYFPDNTQAAGYDNFGGAIDYPFALPDTNHQFDWTLFSIVDTVPVNTPPAAFMEVRVHVYGQFVGTVYYDDISVSTITGITDKSPVSPNSFILNQNYPNPFNPSTSISYNIPKASVVTIKIYDILGNEIRTLVNGNQNPGIHQTVWNGDNNVGSKVASGTYFYTLKANDNFTAKKMIFLK